MSEKIKVLLHYIVYPMAIATYFRKALEQREDVELKVAGPYTGQFIPWKGGMQLLPKYDVPPDIPIPFHWNVVEYNYEVVQSQLHGWKPDLILQIDANLHFKYRPNEGYVATVATDPHVLNYDVPRSYSDKFFNMQLCYSKKGDIYLPYAYSKYDHFPVADVEKDVDATLIGLDYQQRIQWVNELRSRGLTVLFENGPVFDEARTMYNRARMGLNWSTLDDLNARAFEIPAMKLTPIMNLVPDIGRFFSQGEDYLGFTTLDEAVERTMWAHEHPVESQAIAEHAYKTVQPHTYDQRVETILQDCGFV